MPVNDDDLSACPRETLGQKSSRDPCAHDGQVGAVDALLMWKFDVFLRLLMSKPDTEPAAEADRAVVKFYHLPIPGSANQRGRRDAVAATREFCAGVKRPSLSAHSFCV